MFETYEASELKKVDCGVVEGERGSLEVLLPDGRQYTHWIKSGWNASHKGSVEGKRGIRWLLEEAKINRGLTKRERQRKRIFKLKLRTRIWIFWLIWACALGVVAGWQLRGIWE